MAFLTKYGSGRHIYVPVVKAGGTNFTASADWTPAAGDVKISKDGGAAANVTNLPAAIAMGSRAIWDFSLTSTETAAAQIAVTVSNASVVDQSFLIETYGNASAEHVVDWSQALPANFSSLGISAGGHISNVDTMTTYTGNTPQTGDVFGALPTHFSSLSITAAGLVAVTSSVKKNTALTGFTFTMTDSTTHNPKTGLTVTATRALDGGSFASCANSVSEIAFGDYAINLAAADLNGNVVMLRFTATNADDLNILIVTQP